MFQVPPYDDENEQSKSIQRKRVLPSWMLDSDLLVQRVSKPAMKGGRFACHYTLMCFDLIFLNYNCGGRKY